MRAEIYVLNKVFRLALSDFHCQVPQRRSVFPVTEETPRYHVLFFYQEQKMGEGVDERQVTMNQRSNHQINGRGRIETQDAVFPG